MNVSKGFENCFKEHFNDLKKTQGRLTENVLAFQTKRPCV